jgi:hypothetical protein
LVLPTLAQTVPLIWILDIVSQLSITPILDIIDTTLTLDEGSSLETSSFCLFFQAVKYPHTALVHPTLIQRVEECSNKNLSWYK